ncbi:MAG: hypothetical protein JW795_09075 [Chitinivibrionales bacterium]|nr:hypothetical protein [Chitinivibrionales bacterium]
MPSQLQKECVRCFITQTTSHPQPATIDRRALKKMIVSRMFMLLGIFLLFFFLPAGTAAYWQ